VVAPPYDELDPATIFSSFHWKSMIQLVTLYDIKVVFVQKITFVVRKINKNCCHQGCTF